MSRTDDDARDDYAEEAEAVERAEASTK